MAESGLASTLAESLRRLRGLTDRPLPERLRPEVVQVAESFFPHLPLVGEDLGAARKARSAAAHLLLARAEKAGKGEDRTPPDPGLAGFYLGLLARFGSPAEALLAARAVRRTAEGTAAEEVLAEIPPEILLGVLDRCLAMHWALHPTLRQACLGRLAQAASDPEACSSFLDRRVGGLLPSFAAAEAILSGPWGTRAMDLLRQGAEAFQAGREADPLLPRTLKGLAALGPAAAGSASLLPPLLEAGDPDLLLAVLAAVRSVPDRAAARQVARLLTHPEERVRAAAARTMPRLSPKGLGRLFAALYQKDPTLCSLVAGEVLRLGRAEHDAFLAALPPAGRGPARIGLLTALARLDPATVGE